VLQRIMGELGFFRMRRFGLTADEAIGDLAMFDAPAVDAIYDSVIQIVRYGLAAHGVSNLATGV
jgi:hypothetical protein